MRFKVLASLAGIGFVLIGLAVNLVYVRAGLRCRPRARVWQR